MLDFISWNFPCPHHNNIFESLDYFHKHIRTFVWVRCRRSRKKTTTGDSVWFETVFVNIILILSDVVLYGGGGGEGEKKNKNPIFGRRLGLQQYIAGSFDKTAEPKRCYNSSTANSRRIISPPQIRSDAIILCCIFFFFF